MSRLAQYGVMNPLESYNLHMQTLVHLTPEREPSEQATSATSTNNIITDPFEKLSNELIQHVVGYLEGGEVFLLRQASMVVREATSGNDYWIPRVQKEMGWLWVPPDLFREESDIPAINWMRVYLLFESATAHPYGTKGVYMGLANRRRIWTACEQLRSRYVAHAAESGRTLVNTNPDRRTWSVGDEVDSLWSEPIEILESRNQWLQAFS